MGLARVALVTLAIAAVASIAQAAPPPVATKLQLYGHLPDLGDAPALRVFRTASEYEEFKRELGPADVFPPTSRLAMSFATEILVLYYAASDPVGGRSLRSSPSSPFDASGTAVQIALFWETGTAGAPPGARHPFALVSLARTAGGESWIVAGKSVCGEAPGLSASRRCVAVVPAAPTRSPAASPTPTPTPSPTLSPTPSPTPSPSHTPSPTPLPTATPTPSADPAAAAAFEDVDRLLVAGTLVGGGFVAGVLATLMVVAALGRGRTHEV